MVVLRFGSDEVRRECCDLVPLRKRWGPAVARRVSRRLQQLEAMTTLADIDFLPFDSIEHEDGTIEVAVAEGLALFVEPGPNTSEGERPMYEITVAGLGERSAAARTS